MNWYVAHNGQTLGPYTTQQMQGMAAARQITPDMQVCDGAGGQWVAAGMLGWLFTSQQVVVAATHFPAVAASHPATVYTHSRQARATTRQRPVLIEKTAKRYKAMQLIGSLLLIGGFVGIFAASADGHKAAAFLALVSGGVMYPLGRFLAWWHHG